jgi:hypothetical protein
MKGLEKMMRDILTGVVIRAMTIKGHLDVRDMHRNAKKAGRVNEKLLFKILRRNKDCMYGRRYGFSDIRTVEEYRSRVPITTYSDYKDLIDRMVKDDEKGLITSLPLVGYGQSSGSVGTRKFIPITKDVLRIFTKYTVTRMMGIADDYMKKNGLGRLYPGRGMFTLPGFDDVLPNGLPCNNIVDASARRIGFLYPVILSVPFRKRLTGAEANFRYVNLRFALEDKNSMYIFSAFVKSYTDMILYLQKHWETLVEDIENGTVSDLSGATPEARARILAATRPNPARAAELRAEFEKGFDETIAKRLWPHLCVISGIGTSTYAPFAELARKYSKDILFDFSIYGATEGLFAACDRIGDGRQLMLPDSCYYEFIPVDDESRIFSITELEVGRDYEIVITNQAGLYRYKCGDVITVVDHLYDCPYVQFAYRKGQLINVLGEKTTEAHINALAERLSEQTGLSIMHWAAYVDYNSDPCSYVLLIENEKGEDMSVCSADADKLLDEINPRFAFFKSLEEIGSLRIRNQRPGTHAEWVKQQISKGVSPEQVKPVRILDSDEKREFFLSRAD